MKLIRNSVAALAAAALIAGLALPAANAVGVPVLPVVDTTPSPTPSETPVVEDAPTRGEVINLRKVFTSRTKSSIAAVRSLAPQNYPGYFKTAKYAKWYAERHIKHEYNWLSKNYKCLVTLWQNESSWRISASGAGGQYLGIPQLNRPAVVSSGISVATYRSSAELQVQLGAKYIKYRYGNPCNALSHKKAKGWY